MESYIQTQNTIIYSVSGCLINENHIGVVYEGSIESGQYRNIGFNIINSEKKEQLIISEQIVLQTQQTQPLQPKCHYLGIQQDGLYHNIAIVYSLNDKEELLDGVDSQNTAGIFITVIKLDDYLSSIYIDQLCHKKQVNVSKRGSDNLVYIQGDQHSPSITKIVGQSSIIITWSGLVLQENKNIYFKNCIIAITYQLQIFQSSYDSSKQSSINFDSYKIKVHYQSNEALFPQLIANDQFYMLYFKAINEGSLPNNKGYYLKFGIFNPDHEKQCSQGDLTVIPGDINQDISVIQDTKQYFHIIYTSKISDSISKVKYIKLYPNCQWGEEYSTEYIIQYNPIVQIIKGNGFESLVFTYFDQSLPQVKISELFINSDIKCYNQNCEICYSDNSQCDYCKGSTAQNRLIRDNLSDCNCNNNLPYYNVQSQLDCQECKQFCTKCNENGCITCKGQHRSTPTCDCKDGYYEDSFQQCQTCGHLCKKCENEKKCDICFGSNRSPKFQCQCSEGYFSYNQDLNCKRCNQNCKDCKLSDDICTSCYDKYRDPLNKCESCIQGHYLDLNSKQCIECLNGCAECHDQKQCITCLTSDPPRNISQNCSCPQGFYSLEKDPNCYSCGNQCLKCEMVFQNLICRECTDSNLDLLTRCEKCKQVSCNNKNCLKCQDGYNLDGENVCGKNLINPNYTVTLCDPSQKEFIDLHCKTCKLSPKQCTSCPKQQNRFLIEGKCSCDIFYKENSQNENVCVAQEGFLQQQKLQNIVKISSQSAGVTAITGLLFFNPGLIIQMLDTLQQIRYIVFLQIDYPILVQQYLSQFEIYDFQIFPNIVPEHKYYMDAPKGFANQGFDSLLYRNASQYICASLATIGIYIILKFIQKCIINRLNSSDFFIFNGIQSLIEIFEYQILVGGLAVSYLNFTVFCYLQLTSTKIRHVAQFCSIFLSYLILFAESAFPFSVIIIAKDVIALEKNKQIVQAKLDKLELEKQKKGDNLKLLSKIQLTKINLQTVEREFRLFAKKYGVLFEDFKKQNAWQSGYFSIIGFKKIIFALNLVLLNNYPLVNLIIFILLSLATIFYQIYYNPHIFSYRRVRDILTELGFIVIYGSSFPLINQKSITLQLKKTISIIILVAISSILMIELLFLIIDYILMIKLFVRYIIKKRRQQNNNEKDNLSNLSSVKSQAGSAEDASSSNKNKSKSSGSSEEECKSQSHSQDLNSQRQRNEFANNQNKPMSVLFSHNNNDYRNNANDDNIDKILKQAMDATSSQYIQEQSLQQENLNQNSFKNDLSQLDLIKQQKEDVIN